MKLFLANEKRNIICYRIHLEILWKCPKLITQFKLMVLQVSQESVPVDIKRILEILSSYNFPTPRRISPFN